MKQKIPLVLRLKKTAHREIAKAQDVIVETLYEFFEDAVFHGGTAIWRCYGGNRFSEDVDFYIKKDVRKIEQFYQSLKDRGFLIEKKKVGDNTIYSTLKLNDTLVRFEALFKRAKGSLQEYEKTEGNFIAVYTLTPEELIKEKTAAYLGRFKVRDLYDVFFLLRHVENTPSLKRELKKLIDEFRRPSDEKELKVLVTEGIVPSVDDMLRYIERRL